MKESAQFLISSPYIRDLATLVISYGLCINIVEVSWKSKLKVSSTEQICIYHLSLSKRILLTTFLPSADFVCSKHFQTQMSIQPLWGTFHPQQEQ